jgi:hypothetical protein
MVKPGSGGGRMVHTGGDTIFEIAIASLEVVFAKIVLVAGARKRCLTDCENVSWSIFFDLNAIPRCFGASGKRFTFVPVFDALVALQK